jgi:hypothetical protein
MANRTTFLMKNHSFYGGINQMTPERSLLAEDAPVPDMLRLDRWGDPGM